MEQAYITVGIGSAVKLSGVSEKQLRHWESVGYISPERIVCGERAYRRYRATDMELIMEIKKLLDRGFKLSVAVEKAKKSLEGKDV